MNLNYIIGIVGAFGIFLLGCVLGINIGPDAAAAGLKLFTFTPKNLWNFFDAASIFITIGCTLFIVAASFPGSMLKAMP
ncbi:MAG: motility protein A, partial [Oscillibacter sp.]|nr:motility protein A [Oscillibacter sp.]